MTEKKKHLLSWRTKLTYPVLRALLKCVELGMPYKQAALVVGVSAETISRWLARGENPRDEKDEIYVKLVKEIERAQAKFIKANLEIIEKAARRDAHHAEWLLERRLPAEFGKRMEVDVGPSKTFLLLQDMMRAELAKPERTKQLPEGHDVNKLTHNDSQANYDVNKADYDETDNQARC